jgi:hypothetical protein
MDDARLRLQCVSPPKPAILFGGRHVSFYMIIGIGQIEIIEEAAQPPSKDEACSGSPAGGPRSLR